MSKLTKKIVVGVVAFSLAFTAVGVAFAEEDDLGQEVESLEQMLADLQAEIAGLNGEEAVEEEDEEEEETTAIEGVPADFSFTENLSQGATGSAVKYLQIVLNSDEDTRVAASGAGSPGNETEYFGPATNAAVIKFQNKYASEVLEPVGLTEGTGYVGAQTRAKLNEVLDAGDVTKPDPSEPSADLEQILDQLAAVALAIEDLSERVEAIEKDDPTDPDAREGDLSVERRGSPRNVELDSEQTKDVATYRIEAEYSDVTVHRMDLYIYEDAVTVDDHLDIGDVRDYIDRVAIHTGGEIIGETDVDRATFDRDDERIRFSGLSIEIEEDGYADVVVEVTASDEEDEKTYYIGPGIESETIRGVDNAGLTVYTEADELRSFKITGEEGGELDVSRHSDSPEEGIVLVSDSTSTEVELLRAEVSASDGDIEDFDKLVVDLDLGGTWATETHEDIVQDLILYDGDDYLDDVNIDYNDDGETAEAVFTPDIDIADGTTKVLRVVADVAALDIDEQGFGMTASILEGNNEDVAYDAADNRVDLEGNARGYEQGMFVVAPSAVLDSSSINTRGDDETGASASMDVSVTAHEGDIYFPEKWLIYNEYGGEFTWNVQTSSDAESYRANELDYDAPSGTAIGLSDLEDGDTVYLVEDGETEEFELKGNISTDDENEGWVRMAVSEIGWFTENDDGDGYLQFLFDDDMDAVDDLETNSVFKEGR